MSETQEERKVGRTGRPIDPVSGLEIYEEWANFVPPDGIKPGETRPAGVPGFANYWEEPDQATAAAAVAAAEGEPIPDTEPEKLYCGCGKTFENNRKLRGHKMHCNVR